MSGERARYLGERTRTTSAGYQCGVIPQQLPGAYNQMTRLLRERGIASVCGMVFENDRAQTPRIARKSKTIARLSAAKSEMCDATWPEPLQVVTRTPHFRLFTSGGEGGRAG